MAKRKWTDDDLAQLEAYAAIRLPMQQIAIMFGYRSEPHFRDLIKKSEAAQRRLALGHARSSAKFRKTLFEAATVDKNPRLMEFWAKTQEGFSYVDKVEHSGLVNQGFNAEQLQDLFSDPDSMNLARALAERMSKAKGEPTQE